MDEAAPVETTEPFLRRWSERKREARTSGEPGEAADTGSRGEAQKAADASTAPQLTDADMPPLESLDEGSEYSGFMSPGVSEELRKLALRRLFHLPGFNLRDGLDDYDEDFTSFAALGDVMTQDLRHRIETAAKRRAEEEQSAQAPREPPAQASGGEDPSEPADPSLSRAEDATTEPLADRAGRQAPSDDPERG